MTANFFESPQGAAIFKHAILHRYLRMFTLKLGSKSKRVCYLDGYAGPPYYEDGAPAGVAHALTVADLVTNSNDLDGFLIEEEAKYCDRLRAELSDADSAWIVRQGLVEEHLTEALAWAAAAPLICYLDPFGLGLPYKRMVSEIFGRRGPNPVRPPATEILVNVSAPGIARNAGHLDSQGTSVGYLKGRETILTKTDAAMGGEWWRDIWLNTPEDRRVEAIARTFCERLAHDVGGEFLWVPVADRPGVPADYWFALFTRHEDGRWLFAQAISKGREEFQEFTAGGQMELPILAEISRNVIEDQIAQNLRSLLEERSSFRVGKEMARVYGRTLGYARDMHIRAAIKTLHTNGETGCDGKGDVQKLRVSRPPS